MNIATFLTTYQDQPHETLFERLEEFISAQKDKDALPLLQEVVINLSSQDTQTVLTSLSFLRDTLLVPIKTKHAQTALDLRELVKQTDLFLALEKCLYSESQAIRLDAIYTSGKLYFSEMIPVLKRAIPFFEEKEQIELEHLLQEYFWLVGSNKYVEVQQEYGSY